MVAGTKAAIIVPLYIYPIDETTWQPLHQAISDYPELHFVVIINPNSGPGVDPDGWLPDKHYSREIPRLSGRPNVTTIGYVRVDYCRRPLREVRNDITKFANWSGTRPNGELSQGQNDSDTTIGSLQFALHGIFFDEVPNVWRVEDATYLEEIGSLVKSNEGIVGNRTIVHNSGTVPDPEYPLYWRGMYRNRKFSQGRGQTRPDKFRDIKGPPREPGDTRNVLGSPDITVVFEESSALWNEEATQSRLKDLLYDKWEKCSYMIHSVPGASMRMLVREMKHRGAYLFLTELQDRYYESFGSSWQEFVDLMADEDDMVDDGLFITINSRATWIKKLARDTFRGLNCPLL